MPTMTRAARLSFPAMVCLLPFVALLAPHGVVPLCVLGGIALVTDPGVRARFAMLAQGRLAKALACLLAWCAISSIWSPHFVGGVLLTLQLAGVMLAGFVLVAGALALDESAKRLTVGALCLAGPLFLLVMGSELLDGGILGRISRGWPTPFYSNPVLYDRGAAIASIAAWPIAFALRRRAGWRASALFLVVLFAFLCQLEMAAARLAFLVAGAIFLISFWQPRFAAQAMITAMMLLILAVPPALVALDVAPKLPELAKHVPETDTSTKHRLLISQFVLTKIGERPFSGFGFDASRALPGGQAPAMGGQPVLPLHPHNAIFQVWLELGAPGAILAAAIVAIVMCHLFEFAPRAPAATSRATFAAYMTIAVISFGIWQNWWLMLAWFMAAILKIAAEAEPRTKTA